jgi:hypothetical protein
MYGHHCEWPNGAHVVGYTYPQKGLVVHFLDHNWHISVVDVDVCSFIFWDMKVTNSGRMAVASISHSRGAD